MSSIKELYKLGIQASGQKYAAKVEAARNKWKARATSDEAEIKYAIGVVEAAKEGRRKRGLEKVSPEEWARAAAEGYNAFATNPEKVEKAADRWARNAEPYINVVKEISKMLEEAGITGLVAARFWAEVVVPLLAKYRGKPEEVGRILDEVRSKIEQYKGMAVQDAKARLQRAVNELLASL